MGCFSSRSNQNLNKTNRPVSSTQAQPQQPSPVVYNQYKAPPSTNS